MSLTLEFDNQLLVGGNGSAIIHIDNSMSMEITGIKAMRRMSYSSSPNPVLSNYHFFICIGQLPRTLQEDIRLNMNKIQQGIHDRAPKYQPQLRGASFRTLNGKIGYKQPRVRKVPMKLPPESIDVSDDYKLVIQSHTSYRGHESLRLGKKLVIYAKKPYDHPKYTVGTITGMFLPRP